MKGNIRRFGLLLTLLIAIGLVNPVVAQAASATTRYEVVTVGNCASGKVEASVRTRYSLTRFHVDPYELDVVLRDYGGPCWHFPIDGVNGVYVTVRFKDDRTKQGIGAMVYRTIRLPARHGAYGGYRFPDAPRMELSQHPLVQLYQVRIDVKRNVDVKWTVTGTEHTQRMGW